MKTGLINTDENGMTNIEGVFAGGDVVTGGATVTLAVKAGRDAAECINDYIIRKEKDARE